MERKSKGLGLLDIINFRTKCSDTSLDGQDLLRMLGSSNGLTPFGKKHCAQIADLATLHLRDYHRQHDANLLEHFVRHYDFAHLTEADFTELRQRYASEKDFLFWKDMYEREERSKYPRWYAHHLFGGAPIDTPHVKCEAIPSVVSVAATNLAKSVLRECENTVREEGALPRVGEGWISESELLCELRRALPNEDIVHHSRPAWLSPQHLDVHFTKGNVAIEYQGAQHIEPVEYYGGPQGFAQQQRRDRRKMKLCKEHGCKLIYVYQGYGLADVVNEIRGLLKEGRSD